jgi:hypothetical protein
LSVHLCTFAAAWAPNVFASQSIAKTPIIGVARAYQIGPDGHIKAGVDLDCADDAEAIEAADRLVGEYAVELWQDTRMIARLAAPPTRAP